MSYFSRHYDKLTFPIAVEGRNGLRPAQIAAAQAAAAHFFSSKKPAIITMPTGSGKTTVLMASAFMLNAKRVLVITPSRLVREQIAENFASLIDLKRAEALPIEVPAPKVFSAKNVIKTSAQWEALRDFDVVVATVPSIGSYVDTLPTGDMFDLVLVDEAHHSPASTWARLLSKFQMARQILFTATPFRRDDKEIQGKFVFSYELRRAYEDRVFGDISFQPVNKISGQNIDITIAQATERCLERDRSSGFRHLVMVRVDSLSRGKELSEIYAAHTNLKLAFVSGGDTLKKVKGVIAELKSNELDGIVCVNMFGEGFNLPALKIAAVHSPHKSLAVTLQFIGRFARTSQADVGPATFLAEPVESNAEISELYETGAVWRDIVQNLSEGRIESEINKREVLDSFEVDAAPDMEDFSLYTVRPYFHVKIFRAGDSVDLSTELEFPSRCQMIFKGNSDASSAVAYITRQTVRSPWCADERFANVSYDLFIVHHNTKSDLLFISSSRRDDQLYNRLATQILKSRPRILAHSVVSRALNNLETPSFFSVGMRKRHTLGRIESYRTSSGANTDRAIGEADGRLFGRGHCFGTATEDGKPTTIGVSASSKVWSNTYDQIPELLAWCDNISEKIASGVNAQTGSKLDLLSVGEEIIELPENVIAMSWPSKTYRDAPFLFYHDEAGAVVEAQLLDCDLKIISCASGSVVFAIVHEKVEWKGVYRIADEELIQAFSPGEMDFTVHFGNEDNPIADYLNAFMPTFYCSDMSSIEGVNILRVAEGLDPVGEDTFEPIDWTLSTIDITKEIWDGKSSDSIFDWLSRRLATSGCSVIFCDHGSGELADFITLEMLPSGPLIKLYHCKASGGAKAGNRVDDLYDACGQAIKSTVWLRPEELLSQLNHRATLHSVKGYIKGDAVEAKAILDSSAKQRASFEIYIVQPGIKSIGRSKEVSELLAATKHYVVTMGGVEKLGLICS